MKQLWHSLFLLGMCIYSIFVIVNTKAVLPPGVDVNNVEDNENEVKGAVEIDDNVILLQENKDDNVLEVHQNNNEKIVEVQQIEENVIQMNQNNDVKKEENSEEHKEDHDGEDENDEHDAHDAAKESSYESFNNDKSPRKKDDFEGEPPEHWDGVRIDRFGKINGDVEQELFLGPDHDDFESIPEEVGKEKLEEIFKLVDIDGDAHLTLAELINWITIKTEEHFTEGVQASKVIFPKVDTNKDGKLTWDEYIIQFLKQRGYGKNKIEKFKEGKNVLQEHDEEDFSIYRDRWETADENEDDALSQDEFVSFMHPEHSERMLSIIVEEVLHELDQNGDKRLTLTEFVSVPLSREEDLPKMEKEDEWIRERKKEFQTRIDLDKDGIATFNELKIYMNPRNQQYAEGEARHLMGVADDNQDDLLSLTEVLANYYVFIGSKVYNYARNVHDEF